MVFVSRPDDVEVDIEIIRVTAKAYLVATVNYEDEDIEIWLPRSQIDTDCWAEGDEGYAVVPRWLALEKELISNEDDD